MRLFILISFALGISMSTVAISKEQLKLKALPGKTIAASTNDGLVNADFPEPTDVRDIARAFTLWLDKPYEVEASVQTKVTLISPERITKAEAEKRFLKMLSAYNLKTVETDTKILIVNEVKDCGPVPPGGVMDGNCNYSIAPSPE